MSKKLNDLNTLSEAVAKALELAEAAWDALDSDIASLFSEAERCVAAIGTQPCDAKLIVHQLHRDSLPTIEFALLGEFSDFHNPGSVANYIDLRDGICGGKLDLEILDDWLTPEARKLVLDFGSRSACFAAEAIELKRLVDELGKIKDRIEDWELRIQNRIDRFDPDTLEMI